MAFEARFPDLAARLREAYDEAHRAYHSWTHIETLLADFDRLRAEFTAPDAVEIAIWYHDAIYAPFSKTNERDSAERMRSELDGQTDAETLAAAEVLILATETHEIPDGLAPALAADCALFLDMDMAILGAQPAAFDTYDAGVRAEYAEVPEPAFRQGRQAILSDFLNRDRLYLTDMFHQSHDAQARENLRRAIGALSD